MKRLLSFLLVCICAVTLCACDPEQQPVVVTDGQQAPIEALVKDWVTALYAGDGYVSGRLSSLPFFFESDWVDGSRSLSRSFRNYTRPEEIPEILDIRVIDPKGQGDNLDEKMNLSHVAEVYLDGDFPLLVVLITQRGEGFEVVGFYPDENAPPLTKPQATQIAQDEGSSISADKSPETGNFIVASAGSQQDNVSPEQHAPKPVPMQFMGMKPTPPKKSEVAKEEPEKQTQQKAQETKPNIVVDVPKMTDVSAQEEKEPQKVSTETEQDTKPDTSLTETVPPTSTEPEQETAAQEQSAPETVEETSSTEVQNEQASDEKGAAQAVSNVGAEATHTSEHEQHDSTPVQSFKTIDTSPDEAPPVQEVADTVNELDTSDTIEKNNAE